MQSDDLDFSLIWPRDLFLWESGRILALQPNESLVNMAATLAAEAFADNDVAAAISQPRSTSIWDTPPSADADVRQLLTDLRDNPTRLHSFEPPRYWLERTGGAKAVTADRPLSAAFQGLVSAMRAHDYFPQVLRKQCVDDHDSWDLDPSEDLSRAIRATVNWGEDLPSGDVSEEILFSVIEYFHDQAQRPRTRYLHSYNECGWHYQDFNKESGGVVYRSRVNELLESYGVGFRLGSRGAERGRLIRHATLQLDELAERLSDEPQQSEDEKVAAAISLYRSRSSSVHDRRGAVAQLAGYLERHRDEFKRSVLTSPDESDLFNIFNNFSIRHDRANQKSDYDEAHLDWIFWTTLAGIQLTKSLSTRREATDSER